MQSKWHDYYSRSFLPWDTRTPASQLVHFLTTCPARFIAEYHEPVVEDGKDRGSGSATNGTGLRVVTGLRIWLPESEDARVARGQHPSASLSVSSEAGNSTSGPDTHACASTSSRRMSNASVHVCPACKSLRPPGELSSWSALELGCGTGARCAWMHGSRPVCHHVPTCASMCQAPCQTQLPDMEREKLRYKGGKGQGWIPSAPPRTTTRENNKNQKKQGS